MTFCEYNQRRDRDQIDHNQQQQRDPRRVGLNFDKQEQVPDDDGKLSEHNERGKR